MGAKKKEKKKALKTQKEKRKWQILGGQKINDIPHLMVKCPTGHYYIHELKEYPARGSIFTKCPDCKLEQSIQVIEINIPGEKEPKKKKRVNR